MKTILSYKVTENNAGGISLWVFDDGKGNQYAHTSYQHHPKSLWDDIKTLYEPGNSVTDWDGNDLTDKDLIKDIKAIIDKRTRSVIYPSDDDIFDDDGNIIPLDIYDIYDDHPTTKVIAEGDANSLTIYTHRLGTAGVKCFDVLLASYRDEDGYIEQEKITFDIDYKRKM